LREPIVEGPGNPPEPPEPPDSGEGYFYDGSDTEQQIVHSQLNLSFPMPPKGHVSDIIPVLRLLQDRFTDIDVTLRAQDGKISEEEFDISVREAFRQMGILLQESL